MNKGVVSALAGASFLALTLACGGGGGALSGNAANKPACEAYVDHMNSMSCLTIEYNKDDMCSMVDMSPIDMTGYYQCLVDNSTCEGDIPKLEVDGCTMPTM